MKAEFNIDDFITEEDKREIAISAYRSYCDEVFKKEADIDRLIANQAYEILQEIIEREHGIDYSKVIPERVVKAIGELSAFTVFREPDAWSRGNTSGYKIMMQALEDNKDLVEKRVKDIIGEIDAYRLSEAIGDIINSVLVHKQEP